MEEAITFDDAWEAHEACAGHRLGAQGENHALAATLNRDIAGRLDEVARILEEKGANRFRVQAYHRAAATLRHTRRPVSELYAEKGLAGLEELPGVGESIARSIGEFLTHGRLAMLDRLRGESDPIALLRSVPGIGQSLAWRLYDGLGIETLEELEVAAHNGRLEKVTGLGAKRLAGIRDSLAHRLRRVRQPVLVARDDAEPSIGELLDVDREYRERVAAGTLKEIAPRRFNPTGEAWLPVLHTSRDKHHYTALFSNTARAHQLQKTADWVVLYYDAGRGERQCTIITADFGALRGRRIVRGREADCLEHYRNVGSQATVQIAV